MTTDYSNLVDKVKVIYNSTVVLDVIYDSYNDSIKVIEFSPGHSGFRELKFIYSVQGGEHMLLMYLKHMLSSKRRSLGLGSGKSLTLKLSECYRYSKVTSKLDYLKRVFGPMYVLEDSFTSRIYNIYAPVEYVVKLVTNELLDLDIDYPDSILPKVDGSSVLELSSDVSFEYRGLMKLFKIFESRQLKQLYSEYVSDVNDFIYFVIKNEFGPTKTNKELVNKVLGKLPDYLLRDEKEKSLFDSLYGITFKWNYIERAVLTPFGDMLKGNKLLTVNQLSTIFKQLEYSPELEDCVSLVIPTYSNKKIGMILYIVKDSYIVASIRYELRRSVKYSFFETCDEELKEALCGVFLIDTHTKNILSSSGDTKRYFIDMHKDKEKPIDYFKGVDWIVQHSRNKL